jgi:hypothetical protein
MSLVREMRIKTEALKFIETMHSFQEMLNEYLVDESVKSIDKVEITEWLEREGLGEYV